MMSCVNSMQFDRENAQLQNVQNSIFSPLSTLHCSQRKRDIQTTRAIPVFNVVTSQKRWGSAGFKLFWLQYVTIDDSNYG